MRIQDFVEHELAHFRSACNFTPDELDFFELCAKGASLVEIEIKLPCSKSKVSRLSKAVKRKILRVLQQE